MVHVGEIARSGAGGGNGIVGPILRPVSAGFGDPIGLAGFGDVGFHGVCVAHVVIMRCNAAEGLK